MKKYWKNAKKSGKVREIRQSKKVGTMVLTKLSHFDIMYSYFTHCINTGPCITTLLH